MKVELYDETPLRWPEGWPRTLLQDRKTNASWKKSTQEYRKALVEELSRLGAVSARISRSEVEQRDPSAAVWFSLKKTEDFSWQIGLKLDNPAPTLDEIDSAFKALAMKHHPDRVAQTGGDVKIYSKLDEYRKQAKAFILGADTNKYENAIGCDTFKEFRLNLCGIKMALSYIRGLERVGVPGMTQRIMSTAFKPALGVGHAEPAA